MTETQSVLPSQPLEAAQPAMTANPNSPQPRRRLRHYLVGSPEDTQHAIDRLHLLGYLDRLVWLQPIPIPEAGLIIRPDPGDVLRYTQRDGHRRTITPSNPLAPGGRES